MNKKNLGGNVNYKPKVWQAICVLTAANAEEATAFVNMKIDDSRLVKSIEPGLLAALIHFDMCLMKSSINLKEKCQVLESLNVLIQLLGSSRYERYECYQFKFLFVSNVYNNKN